MKNKFFASLSCFFFALVMCAPRIYAEGSGAIAVTVTIEEPVPAEITGRYVFYNNSAFGRTIAPDKEALLPGQTAAFANYTSYSKGINGVMIDISNLPSAVLSAADDFRFKTGNDNNPAGWPAAPNPSSVTVERGAGADGSDRVTLIWPDNAVQKQWLQIKALATGNTGLTEENTFYFGNAIGECGSTAADAKVNALDMLGARDNQRDFLNPAPIDFLYDYNRDARVDVTDMLIARDNQTHFLNALILLTAPNKKNGVRPDP